MTSETKEQGSRETTNIFVVFESLVEALSAETLMLKSIRRQTFQRDTLINSDIDRNLSDALSTITLLENKGQLGSTPTKKPNQAS